MANACANRNRNNDICTCTYAACERHGVCCECLQYHLKNQQLPGCCFPKDAEATYDRSFRKFIEVWGAKAK
ncbi:MAG: DUF6485 family protein [bacterium]|nr:DUF6485 family protein [bacterium]